MMKRGKKSPFTFEMNHVVWYQVNYDKKTEMLQANNNNRRTCFVHTIIIQIIFSDARKLSNLQIMSVYFNLKIYVFSIIEVNC